MKQLNEVKRMQELAGLTKEAPAMPPVPGKSSSSNLSDSLKEKYIQQAFDVVGSTATYKKYKILDDSEIKTLEDILDKVMTGFQNLK
jgi:hypothetical protein